MKIRATQGRAFVSSLSGMTHLVWPRRLTFWGNRVRDFHVTRHPSLEHATMWAERFGFSIGDVREVDTTGKRR